MLLPAPSWLGFRGSGFLRRTERFATDRLAHADLLLPLISELVAEWTSLLLDSIDRFNDLVAQAGLESTDRGS
jgi:hypothetical protein